MYTNTTRSQYNKYDWREQEIVKFFRLNESTPYFNSRTVMPRNLFSIEGLSNDAETWFVIDEDIANIDRSSFSVNYTRDAIFRADQRIMFNMTVRD